MLLNCEIQNGNFVTGQQSGHSLGTFVRFGRRKAEKRSKVTSYFHNGHVKLFEAMESKYAR